LRLDQGPVEAISVQTRQVKGGCQCRVIFPHMRIHQFRNPVFLLPFVLVFLLLSTTSARATTRTVTSLADSGAGTLRDAIAASGDGDLINFSVTGVISLTSGALVISKSITIAGPGPTQLEVTRGNSSNFRIFYIWGGPATTIAVFMSGISVTNGHTVVNSGETDGGLGGGILNTNATLTLSNCIINNNTAVSSISDSRGGGICSFSTSALTTLTVDGCTFSGNNANFGGAISNLKSLVLKNSTLSGNSADFGGGLNTSRDTAAVSNCTFVNNTATSQGGGASNLNGTLTVSNCTFDHNTSNSSGGGISNEGQGNNGVGNATVNNCTLSGNIAPSGGGIYNTGTQAGNAFVQLGNTILQTGSSGANLVNNGSGTSITSQGYNLSNDDGGGFLVATGDQKNTNPQLGPLQNNGGPTLTRALLTGSPAQDKGKNFNGPSDQRGFSRPVDIASIPNANGGDGSDIGAVEMDTLQTGPTFVVTTTSDHDDGSCSVGDCTLREAINVANSASGANTISFMNSVTGVITLQSGLGTLTVTDSVTITGPGARVLSVSGNNARRVFTFNNGSSAISGLTIRDGSSTDAAGSGRNAVGGGVFNGQNASLTITDCTLTANLAQGASNATASGAGGQGDGGAISNSGTMTVTNCTLVSNNAFGGMGADASGAMGANLHGGDGGAALGAAIFNDTNAVLTISNSTVVSNIATGGAAANGQFGGNGGTATAGIYNNGTMTVTAGTLTRNRATGGAAGKGSNNFNGGSVGAGRGGLTSANNTSVVRDTISASNVGNNSFSDAAGAFASQGYNLIGAGDASSGFTSTGDQLGTSSAPVAAQLSLSQNNGGNTDTCALSPNSPAVDKGKAFGLAFDQRGFPFQRVVGSANAQGGDGSDIGAFEVQPTPTPTPTPTATPTATPIGTPTATPGLVANVSTRLPVGTGDNVLIEGFTVQGPAGSTKKIIVRAIGPFLAGFGITDALANPTLEIHDSNNNNAIVATNDDWKITQFGTLITADQSAEIAASGFAPNNDLESAIIANLPPSSYTAVVRGVGNSVGTGVVDAFDLSPAASARLVNIATRGLIQPGDQLMIAGFIIQNGSVRAVIKAIGPSLAAFGITNALADTTLQIRTPNGAIVVENDDWKVASNGTSQQAELEATGLQPTNDLEAAVLTTLPPGQYSALVRGKPESTGTGVVQVYFLP
jgi:CSLREA domain-containing protein